MRVVHPSILFSPDLKLKKGLRVIHSCVVYTPFYGKSSKWVENTVGKGEIARYEQFLLFRVFSKGFFPRGIKKCHCVGMG